MGLVLSRPLTSPPMLPHRRWKGFPEQPTPCSSAAQFSPRP